MSVIPSVTMFPRPRTGYYEWGDGEREEYAVLGIAMTEPDAPDAARLYHATWLLVERTDHRLTWLSISALTLDGVDADTARAIRLGTSWPGSIEGDIAALPATEAFRQPAILHDRHGHTGPV